LEIVQYDVLGVQHVARVFHRLQHLLHLRRPVETHKLQKKKKKKKKKKKRKKRGGRRSV
jgi:hypothetical protein